MNIPYETQSGGTYICELEKLVRYPTVDVSELASQGLFLVGDDVYRPTWPRGHPNDERLMHDMILTGLEIMMNYYVETRKTPDRVNVTWLGKDIFNVIFEIPK